MKYRARITDDLFFPLSVNSMSIPNTGISTAITTKKRPVISCGASLGTPSNVTAQRVIHNKPVTGPIILSKREGSSSIRDNFQIKGKKCNEICGRLKNVHIFAIAYQSCISNDAQEHTETKFKGGHTGASPAVISVHRTGLVRSDPPSLFNQIHNIMRTNDDGVYMAPPGALSPEEILNDVILSDDPHRLRQHLRAMADAYLLTEDEAGYRHSVFATYIILDAMLSKIEKLIPNTIAA